jgi:ATP-dependent Clp protease ATP-binding subunit ClpA
MATTTEEYNANILPNIAFVSRTAPIKIEPMTADETKDVLREDVQANLTQLEFSANAFDKILEISETHPTYKPRFNPRKSLQILEYVTTKALEWSPTALLLQLQNQEATARDLQVKSEEKIRANPKWSKSIEGKAESHTLKQAQEKVTETRKKIAQQEAQHRVIQSIRKLLKEYDDKWISAAHILASQSDSQTEKLFLYTKFVAVPAIKRLLDKKLADFEKDVGQKLSVKIDENFTSAQFK